MRGSRLYKERDGVVYDTYTASLIFPGQAMLMQYLAVTPEGRYFVAMIASVSRFGHAIFPLTRRGAVEFAIKYKAPDSILQDIGVTIQSPPESDDPYNQRTARFIWVKPRLLGRDWLLQHHDGRYFLLKNRRMFKWRWQRTRPMDQRQALRRTLRDHADNDALQKLGLAVERGETRELIA